MQKLSALAMIVVEGFIFAYISEKFTMPVASLGLAIAGMLRKKRLVMSRDRGIVVSLVMFLMFILLWRVAPYHHPTTRGYLMFDVSYTVGSYFLILQGLQFFLVNKKGMTPMMPIFGIIVFAAAGNFYADPDENRIYMLCSFIFAALIVIYLRSGRKKPVRRSIGAAVRNPIVMLLMVAVIALSITSSAVILKHERNLELMGVKLVDLFLNVTGTSIGFSSEARLGSLGDLKGSEKMNKIQLRVFSAGNPGYMRGRVYGEYKDARWQALRKNRRLDPSGELPGVIEPEGARGDYFSMTEHKRAGKPRVVDVWPGTDIQEAMFGPAGIDILRAPITLLDVDDSGVMDTDDLPVGVNYVEYVWDDDQSKLALTEDEIQLYTSLPENLDPRIAEIAGGILDGKDTAKSKIAAVTQYLGMNHEYHLGIKIPSGEDPLAWFLENKKPAHCEYFASAAAIMLRTGGVPTRYVNGFMVSGRNALGRYWFARNADAHAWVEAFVSGRGWQIVEATPAAGVPGVNAGNTVLKDFLDWLKFELVQLQVALYTDGFLGVMKWLGNRLWPMLLWFLSASPSSIVVKLVILFFLARRISRVLRLNIRRHRDIFLYRMHKVLSRADRLAGRMGFKRERTETLSCFASRVSSDMEALADWYGEYAGLRYGPVRDLSAIEALAAKLADIAKNVRESKGPQP